MADERGKELKHWRTYGATETPRGPMLEETERLAMLFRDYRPVLERGEEGGKPCFLIPEVTVTRYDGDGRPTTSKAYFFMEQKRRRNNTPTIYAFVNPDITVDDDERRISIDVAYGQAVAIDDSSDFDNVDLMKALIAQARSELEEKLEARKQSRRTIQNKIVGWTSLAACIGVAGFSVNHFYFAPKAAEKQRREQLRKMFDASGYQIPGKPIEAGRTVINYLPKSEFETIPPHQPGDKLSEARRFELGGGTNNCHNFKIVLGNGEEIYIALPKKSEKQDPSLSAGADAGGKIFVCDFSGGSRRDIAIQVESSR